MVSEGQKVLVVEDEADMRELLCFHLRREGWAVLHTGDGYEAWEIVQREPPELVLIDLMINGMSGLQLCRQIRSRPDLAHVRMIIVSARTAEEVVLDGLCAGADDYVRKPFRLKEILARVRSVLRRERPQMDRREATLESPPLSLDHSRREVRLAGRVLSLTATEYGLLRHLMSHPGRVLSRAQLLDAVGDGRSASSGRSIDVHVLSLRRKLGDQGAMIGTARGFGYVFAPLKNPAAGDAVGLWNA